MATRPGPTLLTAMVFSCNQEDYIGKAIESILQQKTTYPFDIWLCDDCSTDGTLEICRDSADRCSDKIKLFAESTNIILNPNLVSHSEQAVRRVASRYFCYLDADDFWCDKEKIQITLDVVERNPEYVTFAHDTLYHDAAGMTRKSLVHEIHRAAIRNPVLFESAP